MSTRTTVTLDDDLLAEAKQRAALTGRTLSELVQDALRASFLRRTEAARMPVKLPVSKARGGPNPGVDLNDSAGLLDMMEPQE